MNLIKNIRIVLALIRKYGLRKTAIAYKESSSDRNYVLTNCPECGTEHRIHIQSVTGTIKERSENIIMEV